MKKLLCSLVLAVFLVSSMNVCEALDLKAELPAGVTEEQITITEGWNLIAIPGLPHFGPYTVKQFIKDVEYVWDGRLELTAADEADVSLDSRPIPIKPGEPFKPFPPICPGPQWKVKTVAVYKDGQFKNLPPKEYSYNMVPGEAYFVYAEYIGLRPVGGIDYVFRPKKIIRVPVRKLEQISYHLNRGWNGMSLPKEPPIVDGNVTCERLYTVSDLSKKLVEQGVKATRLAVWSAENQNWEQYTLPYEPVVRPDGLIEIKMLNGNEGFFLLCDENNIFFRDGLEKVQDPPKPPFPPFPPERVSYTGKVYPVMVRCFGPSPPYSFTLGLDNGKQICLAPGNEKVSEQLTDAAGDDRYYRVEGVMETRMNHNNRPDGAPGTPVDVLVVNKVEPAGYVEYTGAVNRAEPGNPYEYVILVDAGPMLPAYKVIPLIYKDENIHDLLRKAEDVRISTIRGEATKIEVNGCTMGAVVVREVAFPLMIIR